MKRTPEHLNGMYVAFNKHIVEEIKLKNPPVNFTIGTLHSRGYQSIAMNHRGKFKLEDWKTFKLLQPIAKNWKGINKKKLNSKIHSISEFYNYYRLTHQQNLDNFEELCLKYDLNVGIEDIPILKESLNLLHEYNVKHNSHNEFMIDFVDMVYLPVYLKMFIKQVDILMVDEAQDLSALQHEFIKKLLKTDGRMVIVGDHYQCQPPETKVKLFNGEDKQINELKIEDKIITYDKHNASFIKNGIIDTIEEHYYDNNMYEIEVGDHKTKSTLNHKWIVKWVNRPTDVWITYLMKKGNRYRIGQCQLFLNNDKKHASDFGLSKRVRVERADCAWILKMHNSLSDALIYEKTTGIKYGIPEVIFHASNKIKYFTENVINEIYDGIDNLESKAIKCLTDHGKDINYPIYTRNSNLHQGRSTIFETQSCNLIPEYMALPITPDEIKRDSSVTWTPIKNIRLTKYQGLVYALNVLKHHKYVSDQIVTCNSIYGFSGSDIESWDKFKQIENLIELPLSLCYRCGKNIVDKSNTVHNIMESPEWMHEGEVIENGNLLYVKSGDFVLCRNTKPLVQLYFKLLSEEKPAYIKGSDIGKGLIKILDEYKNLSSQDTLLEMNKQLNSIYRNLIQYGVQQPQKHQKYLSYREKIDIIELFSLKYKHTKEIIVIIDKIFSDDGDGIVLSTIHKCKGLESNDVYIYLPHLIPSKYAKKDWELDQEANLLYVAMTRAKKRLIFVKDEH